LEDNFGAEACRTVLQAVEAGSQNSAPKILTISDSTSVVSAVQTLTDSLDVMVIILKELAKVLHIIIRDLTLRSDKVIIGPSFR
jgi:hypothetical protein